MRSSTLYAFLLLFPITSYYAAFLQSFDNCKHGNFFVENYIKYECYESDSTKGARIVGCQPSNDLTGITLEAWETYNERWFKYHCVIDGNNAQYSIKACLDPMEEVLPVGKTRSFPSGETFTCFLEKNKVKLNHQTIVGCRVGDQVYGDRATWIDRSEYNVTVGSQNKTIGLGTAMQCQKNTNGTYSVKFAACLTSENTYIHVDNYGTVDNEIVKCSLLAGKCQLREARVTETNCFTGNVVYRHDQEWNSDDQNASYVCKFGRIVKKGCLVSSLLIPINEVRYVDGIAYHCSTETRLRSFGDLKGCVSSSGETIQFGSRVKDGEKMISCSFKFEQTGTLKFVWKQVGCIYSKELVTVNAIQKFGEHYVHCLLNGTDNYIIKLMTKIEVENWLKVTKQQWSNVVSGHEGEGTIIKREIVSQTTTVEPSLIPTTITRPEYNITPKPFTITTSVAPIQTTIPVELVSTTTPKLSVKKCVDLIEDCEYIQMFCLTETEQTKILKDTLQKSSLTTKNKQKMIQFVDLIAGDLIGNNDGNMNSHPNYCSGKNRESGHCKCQSQKTFNIRLLKSLCPKTCGFCHEKRESVSSIIKTYTNVVCITDPCNQCC